MKVNPKFQLNDLVQVSHLKRTFSKGDTTNWPYKLYKISEINNDTIPSYRTDNLPERQKETSVEKTELSMKENDSVMRKLNLY